MYAYRSWCIWLHKWLEIQTGGEYNYMTVSALKMENRYGTYYLS